MNIDYYSPEDKDKNREIIPRLTLDISQLPDIHKSTKEYEYENEVRELKIKNKELQDLLEKSNQEVINLFN